MPAFASMTADLVIVPRHALLRDPLISDRRREHHAVAELLDQPALDLLPRRLARREMVAALLRERAAARGELVLGQQYVDAALVEIDADAVAAFPQQREPAAGSRLGRGVEDRRRARRARLAPVADAGQGG